MAVIIPIRGLRYNPLIVENMADVVTPPYDVIDTAAQERYYRRNPFNIIRLEYGKILGADNEKNNRYTRAAADYKNWLGQKVLIQEQKPAIYLYEQEFTAAGKKKIRSGITCGFKLETYKRGKILPHEETIPKHKADRLQLMRACQANFSPVFSLYTDRENRVITTLKNTVEGTPPDINFTDDYGEIHRMWVITDPDAIAEVQQVMLDKRIFIADGHHRYETALNYKKERETNDAKPQEQAAGSATTTQDAQVSEPAYNYVMMTLVNIYDPGLIVFPTHRLIRNIVSLDVGRLIEQIKENFIVDEYDLDKNNFRQLLDMLEKSGLGEQSGQKTQNEGEHHHVFGLYAGNNRFYQLTLKEDLDLAQMMPAGKSTAWQKLDVSVLHTLIIEKHLGICGELRARADHITYTRGEESAIDAVDRGDYQLAFFLNPTLVDEVTAIAGQGEKMPQKSTFFYPKLITGLVINQL
ncbi:MAG: DUF1015 domain-containing protein [Peptococcaceae bacterium]|nr:DUF1015 domain-containing protein [Candidatus Syntrophopropionicum ammoniitolerans]